MSPQKFKPVSQCAGGRQYVAIRHIVVDITSERQTFFAILIVERANCKQ